MLNEEDVRYGLWKRRTITADTRVGLSLLQHDLWQRAQDVFYNAMNKATQVKQFSFFYAFFHKVLK
jgi:transformation/transcription domain-associated protein